MEAVTREGRGTAGALGSWDFCLLCHNNGGGLSQAWGRRRGRLAEGFWRCCETSVPWGGRAWLRRSFVEIRDVSMGLRHPDVHPTVSGESGCLNPRLGWQEGEGRGKSFAFSPKLESTPPLGMNVGGSPG